MMRATLDQPALWRYTPRTMRKQEFSGDLIRAVAVVLYEENARKQRESDLAYFSRETQTVGRHSHRSASHLNAHLGFREVYASSPATTTRLRLNELPDLLA